MASDSVISPLGTSIESAEITDGSILLADLADEAKGEWVLHETLDFSADGNLSFSSIPTKKVLKLVVYLEPSGSGNVELRFNSDSTATNYNNIKMVGTSMSAYNNNDIAIIPTQQKAFIGYMLIPREAHQSCHMCSCFLMSQGGGDKYCLTYFQWDNANDITAIYIGGKSGTVMTGTASLYYHQEAG